MDKTQLNYVTRRLDEIAEKKIVAIKRECTTPQKSLSAKEFLALAKAGKIKVIPGKEGKQVRDIQYSSSFEAVFDISEYSERVDKARQEKRLEALQDEYTKIKDHLILGDGSEALKMIEAFAKKSF